MKAVLIHRNNGKILAATRATHHARLCRAGLGYVLAAARTLIKEKNFQTLSEVFALVEEIQPGAREMAQTALGSFNPLLITNMASVNARINQLKLRKLVFKYLGITIPDLGNIPFDSAVQEAMRAYLPVSEFSPKAPAAQALTTIAVKLDKVVSLFEQKRQGI